MAQLAPAPSSAGVPPQSREAEESVLGAMMISPRAIDAASEILDAGDFYFESHAKIYRASLALYNAGTPVDAITITEELLNRGELDDVGGRTRMHELAALVPATANVGHYARIVHESAMLRGLIRAGGEIARLGWERPSELAELVERAQEIAFDLSRGAADRYALVAAADVVRDVYQRITELAESGRSIIGVPSGYGVLDALTSGWQPGNLIVVAARPSMGKTALALCSIANVVFGSDPVPVGLFTLEMSRLEVIQRLLSSVGLVDSQKVRTGRNLGGEDWAALTQTSGRIEQAPLFIDDSSTLTMAELRAKARKLKLRRPDLGLIVVDYLQLMTGGGSEENRVQEVSRISRSLKVLAGELDVPVVALSQLSRAVEQRHDKRPILSDLRESGSIEQDADLVLFIYRDEYYNPEDTDQQGIAEVDVAKQRNGPTGRVKLSFVKRYARFSDLPLPGAGSPS